MRPVPLTGFDMPSRIVALPGGGFLFCADQGIAMIPPHGSPRLLVTASRASGYARGPDGAYWFLLPKADAIAKIAADGTPQTAISFPARSTLQKITGADGAVVVLMGTPHKHKFVFFTGTQKLTIPVPGPMAMGVAYDPFEGLIWYGDDAKLSSVSTSGVAGPSIALPGGAASSLAFDRSNRRLWYFDEIGSTIGFIEGGGIVRDFRVEPNFVPNLLLDRHGHLWFAGENANWIERCDGSSLRRYDVSGLADPKLIDLAITDHDEIACLDRWNAVLGIGPLPAGA